VILHRIVKAAEAGEHFYYIKDPSQVELVMQDFSSCAVLAEHTLRQKPDYNPYINNDSSQSYHQA